METLIRAATPVDLPAVFYTWLAAEGEAPEQAPRPDDAAPSALAHVLESGRMLVAERAGRVIGFATAIARGQVTFLGQLFVLPEVQSAGVGQRLLRAVMPDDGWQRATVSSSDPRATALYVRHGMRPFWPVFDLAVSVERLGCLPETDVAVAVARPEDSNLIGMDAEIAGRLRPQDHSYWVEHKAGVPLRFERGGKTLGYGYVLVQPQSSDARWYGDTVRVGPLGVHDEADAVDCLVCALNWARERGGRLSVLVPGPHPGLRTLLEAGFHIGEIETFLSSGEQPFTDGRRYIPSGGGLF